MVQPRFKKKMMNYNSDLIYCFGTLIRCKDIVSLGSLESNTCYFIRVVIKVLNL